MADGELFHLDHRIFEEGEPGLTGTGYEYEGPFGPLRMGSAKERIAAVLRGGQVSEASLAWNAEAESMLENPINILQKDGVKGNVAGTPFRVWWRDGLRRSKRLIAVEMQGRLARVMRLRRWKTWSLETTDGRRLISLKRSWRFAWKFGSWDWKGRVTASADAADVAILLLLVTAGMIYRIGDHGPPYI